MRVSLRRAALLLTLCGFLLLDTSGCREYCDGPELPGRHGGQVTIDQGLWGDVWFWSGDFMPPCPSGTVRGVSREIRVHEMTNIASMEGGPLYRRIDTALVASVVSRADGFFQVELPPGRYSVFSVEDSLFYASGFDGEGNINPITVEPRRVAALRFDIRYQASG